MLVVDASVVVSALTAAGVLSTDAAWLAYADLLDLRIDFYPFAPVAGRVWEMRASVRRYDAWYVALAELLGAPVATVDRRLASSPGLRCEFRTPPEVS